MIEVENVIVTKMSVIKVQMVPGGLGILLVGVWFKL
jgi:hypothetical protein